MNMMKAAIHSKYGPPQELQIREVNSLFPKSNEVLVKVVTASVTTTDCNVRNFTFVPKSFLFFARLMFGFRKPKIEILGIDFAGEVEVVGCEVKQFKRGDQVFGSNGVRFGSHAEYVCVKEAGAIVKKPDFISWEEAASLSLAGNTALFFIRDLAKIKQGQKILIHGASGAIGTYSVQLAKHYGAEVTAVCSSVNVALVKSIGADRVIDYSKEDFSASDERYDFVYDVVGKTTFSQCKRILKKNGVYLKNTPEIGDYFIMFRSKISGGKKVVCGESSERAENLKFLTELIKSGKLKPVIDRVYKLEDIADAYSYAESGHKKGNIIIQIN